MNDIIIIKTDNQINKMIRLLQGWECNPIIHHHMSRLMAKPTICIGENKGADQLRGDREADQRLCFRDSDSTIPPLLNSKISSF